ncbi:hypothetical protein HID58_024736 [Brassica napus]|uniref:Yippee domain-containing protein n=1 Tax=Brassica napus TaxID=3708 RepID=A0ABQ8CL44_BRANA|nr:hypothetical protein HID58_024736 [Brassica napus]
MTLQQRVNINMGPLEERMILSGMHTVADIFCCCCGDNVGWKYSHFQFSWDRNQSMKKIRSIKKTNLFWKDRENEYTLKLEL